MALMLLGFVITAIAIISGVVVWGARHGTLRESDQERLDYRFHEIVRADAMRRRFDTGAIPSASSWRRLRT